MSLPPFLRPFRSRPYALLATGLAMALFSTGCWTVAVTWQVIELGGQPSALAMIAGASSVGVLVAVPFGGVAADRLPQRPVLLTVGWIRLVSFAVVAVTATLGFVDTWHLMLVALAIGATDGFLYPAYTSWVPAILPAEDLLAANGIEGFLGPTFRSAAGPAAAGVLIAIMSPALAFLAMTASQIVFMWVIGRTPRPRVARSDVGVAGSAARDLGAGFRYVVKTKWLLASSLLSIVVTVLAVGPIQVLLPFMLKEHAGGGAGDFALLLTCAGVGGAVGSVIVASSRLPRRYLSVLFIAFGFGSVALAVLGYTDQLWVMAVALIVEGFVFAIAVVLWGTVLQRRVPRSMIGRVASLDFFVFVAFTPISVAVAVPLGQALGYASVFLAAATIPGVLALLAVVLLRLRDDEVRHPLDG